LLTTRSDEAIWTETLSESWMVRPALVRAVASAVLISGSESPARTVRVSVPVASWPGSSTPAAPGKVRLTWPPVQPLSAVAHSGSLRTTAVSVDVPSLRTVKL